MLPQVTHFSAIETGNYIPEYILVELNSWLVENAATSPKWLLPPTLLGLG
jgi:hypothetical protein